MVERAGFRSKDVSQQERSAAKKSPALEGSISGRFHLQNHRPLDYPPGQAIACPAPMTGCSPSPGHSQRHDTSVGSLTLGLYAAF